MERSVGVLCSDPGERLWSPEITDCGMHNMDRYKKIYIGCRINKLMTDMIWMVNESEKSSMTLRLLTSLSWILG